MLEVDRLEMGQQRKEQHRDLRLKAVDSDENYPEKLAESPLPKVK